MTHHHGPQYTARLSATGQALAGPPPRRAERLTGTRVVSVALAVDATAALGTGIWWIFGGSLDLGPWDLFHLHTALGLVAPGRRGFQWVKWVEEVRVTERRELGEWVAVFVSGV